MKKLIISISLLGFVVMGFAQYPVVYNSNSNRYYNKPGNALVIDTRGQRDFTVIVDNNTQYQSSGGAVTINSLRNGYHKILVYENRKGLLGLGKHKQTTIYSSSVRLKPGVETSLFVNHNGEAQVSERQIYGYYNTNNSGRWEDRRYTSTEIRNR